MKLEDKDKLNQCIDILESTDLGLALVWLYVWDVVKYTMDDSDYTATSTEDEVWKGLGEAVLAGHGFSLEYGAESLQEDITDWLLSNGHIKDKEDEEEEDED